MIRLYGFVHQPFVLPSFFTLGVYSLEMIRKRVVVENEHFLNFRKSLDIKFPWAIGPFVIKNKVSLPLIEILLIEMEFPNEASINYDPHHIISNRIQAKQNILLSTMRWQACLRLQIGQTSPRRNRERMAWNGTLLIQCMETTHLHLTLQS